MAAMQTITAHDKDLGGGFKVRRLLPAMGRQSIGPFLFFDHFGPVTVTPESEHDVRPHPHIGLATVTYLFSGAIMHRDSLGSVQQIEPGAINWMTAGKGIVHSERRPQTLAQTSYVNHGIQLWAALPVEAEEAEPSFVHTPADAIPQLQVGDATVRVLIGQAWGSSRRWSAWRRLCTWISSCLPVGCSRCPQAWRKRRVCTRSMLLSTWRAPRLQLRR